MWLMHANLPKGRTLPRPSDSSEQRAVPLSFSKQPGDESVGDLRRLAVNAGISALRSSELTNRVSSPLGAKLGKDVRIPTYITVVCCYSIVVELSVENTDFTKSDAARY
jgi:hypothetical protein